MEEAWYTTVLINDKNKGVMEKGTTEKGTMEKRTTENENTEKFVIDQTEYTTKLSQRFKSRKPYEPPVPGRIYSFIPGTVVEVLVSEGDSISEGDDTVILEAMKMKNRLKSHLSGKVIAVNVKPGDRVTKGTVLVEVA